MCSLLSGIGFPQGQAGGLLLGLLLAGAPAPGQLLLPHHGGGQEARRMGGTGLLQDAIGGDEAVALQPLL